MTHAIITTVSRLTAICVVAAALGACNTTAGAGKDIKSAGSEIEKAAEKAKK